jgi:hypothetical protein
MRDLEKSSDASEKSLVEGASPASRSADSMYANAADSPAEPSARGPNARKAEQRSPIEGVAEQKAVKIRRKIEKTARAAALARSFPMKRA